MVGFGETRPRNLIENERDLRCGSGDGADMRQSCAARGAAKIGDAACGRAQPTRRCEKHLLTRYICAARFTGEGAVASGGCDGDRRTLGQCRLRVGEQRATVERELVTRCRAGGEEGEARGE